MSLRVQADDPDVLALTAQAVRESNRHRDIVLTVRCRHCRDKLAEVGRTPSGLLFASRIPQVTESNLSDGERFLTSAEVHKMAASPGTAKALAGGAGRDTPNGVIALLNLPKDMSRDYPDLIVRCRQHGDTVLDRVAVLEAVMKRRHPREPRELLADGGPVHRLPIADTSWLR